ncbi:hypothetical protein M0804_010471 [Polistes exclamans]|nr:hypothetical protein M0804_010471 [Polistes exclamans]
MSDRTEIELRNSGRTATTKDHEQGGRRRCEISTRGGVGNGFVGWLYSQQDNTAQHSTAEHSTRSSSYYIR